jgi:hypothetical protein
VWGVGKAARGAAKVGPDVDAAAESSLGGMKYLSPSVAAVAALVVAWDALVVVPLVMRFARVAGKMA